MRVRALEVCYVGTDLHQAGDEFNWDGPPMDCLLPLPGGRTDELELDTTAVNPPKGKHQVDSSLL